MIELITSTPPQAGAPPLLAQSPAIAKLEAEIERGQASARRVVDEIYEQQPVDLLVKGTAANFTLTDDNQPGLMLRDQAGEPHLAPIHRHALGQVAQKFGIPWAYVEALRGGEVYHRQLLVHNLNSLAAHDDARYLVRVAHREVRGFLSDRYRRLDSRPILESFVRAAKKSGAEPFEGVLTDTSFSLKTILPVVHEPAPGEAIAFGLELCNSDFGARALSVSLFVLRIRCSNLAVMSEDLRKVHLGSRLSDDAVYSLRTHQLDTALICSAIGDIVDRNFLPARLETVTGMIREAAESQVSQSQMTAWMKKRLTRVEAQTVSNVFNSPEIEMLPSGQTRWRFSNALSLFAASLEGERELDMERLAGEVLQGGV